QYPPLQERGNPVHARHQLRCFLPAAPQSRDFPLVAFGLQARVALPAVGVNRAAWIDAILHKRVQAGSRGVLNHAHPNPPYTRPISLGGDHNQSLTLGLPTRHAFLQPANHRLVHLHPPAQSIPIRSDHRPSQFMQPTPCRLKPTQPEDPLQAQCAGTVLLAGHIPHRTKPHHQRLPRVLENRTRRSRSLAPAIAALEQSGTHQDSLGSLALRTSKTLRPAEADQVRSTRFLRRKALLELLDSSRVVLHDPNLYVGVS